MVVGDNFRFGHKQAGDTRPLGDTGPALRIQHRDRAGGLVPRRDGVSSSGLRQLVEAGDGGARRALAGAALTRSRARWSPGHGVGSKQTVPTLNLATQSEVLPERRRLRHAHDRSGRRPQLAIGHQHRLSADVRRRRPALDRDISARSARPAKRRARSAWSFSGGCATSGSSRVRKR